MLVSWSNRFMSKQEVLPAQIHRSDLAALMTEFGADDQACDFIKGSLLSNELLRSWSPGHRSSPARELAVSGLGVLMPQAMHSLDPCRTALVLESAQLLHISLAGWNQTALAGQ